MPKKATKRRRRSKGMKGRVQETYYLDTAEHLELLAAAERTGFAPAAVTAACTMYGVRLINSGKLKLPRIIVTNRTESSVLFRHKYCTIIAMPKDGYTQISVALGQDDAHIKKAVEQAAKEKQWSRSKWVLMAIRKALGKKGK